MMGTKALRDVRPLELQHLLTTLRQEYSASTVNNIRIGLSKVFSEAMHHRLVQSNPVAGTRKAKRQEWEATQVRLPWTVAEVLRVREVIDSTPLRAPLTLLLYTGMRLGEMLGLRWSDIDFENESLSIERTLSHQSVLQLDGTKKYEVVVRPPKTVSSRRTIKLGVPMLDILALHKAEQDLTMVSAGTSWIDSGYVFTNAVGGPMDASKFRKRFKALMRDGDVREIRLHDIRHTFATILLEIDSAALPAVSRTLGHASISITMDIYARTARIENQATNQMSEILFPVRSNAASNPSRDLRDNSATANGRSIEI